MSTFKTVCKFLLKWTAILAVIAALVVGFSFLERGYLAKEISFALHLPTEEWWLDKNIPPVQRRDITTPVQEDEWHYIQNNNEILSEIKEPNKRVRIEQGRVIGTVQAKEVHLGEDAQVGSILATEQAAIYGGSVKQNVQGARVLLAPYYNPELENNMPRRADYYPDREERKTKGIVYGNIIGGEITTLPGTSVLGQVGTPESQLDLAGTVQGNATGRQVILRSTAVIHGDVITSSESVMMEPGASVQGRIINSDNKPIKIVKVETDGVDTYRNISPERVHYPQPAEQVIVRDNNPLFTLVLLWIPVLLGILATLFITYGFFTKDATTSIENISGQPLRSIWLGFVSVALGLPLMFLLFISIIGIPVSISLGIALILASLVGLSGVCQKIGQKVSAAFGLNSLSQIKEMLLGILLVAHLIWIPILGWIVLLVLWLMGLGSVTMLWWPRLKTRWQSWRQSRKTRDTGNQSETMVEEEPKDSDENKLL